MTLLAAPTSRWRQLIGLIGLALTLMASPVQADDARGIASFVPSPPSLNAKSWVLMDARSGQILVQHNADERLPPASLTKMMTAYITEYEIDNGDLSEDDKIRISKSAWQTGGSRMFVKVGSYVPLRDLMQGIVVQSGNDATVAVAEHVAGSESAFATLMNQYARSMGLKNTHFENPTGLPSEGHYSSAHDLAIIARHIINDFPDHYKLYSEKYFTWNDIRQPNRNLLLWRDKSVDGLKTGHTDAAGYCLVSSAMRDGTRLISVVMGTNSEEARAQESEKLLNYGFRYFETKKLYSKGDVLNKARVWGGAQDEVSIGVDHDVYTTVSAQSDDKLNARLNIQSDINAPISKGQKLGTLEVVQGDKTIDQEPLVALSPVDEGGFIKRMWDHVVKFVFGLFD
ncbi:D-alanyl-D-alanine carboxypeptidase family protein [Kushneria phosphatilytica]|uniref:serine-type D-Ala-D-Ala carboxypeptidase n=1 Tax=Kushneria phosphatilytica TaxID=657387 RepID=A0A1S1NYS7_9GAMM|nr:D-alanyl-D-alanine carboxypeptidase family protein [Kushneria phosphatilytica]OHV13047.1 serine-type D-Ala-D-Ala carboxypeptidase [Kushneria phosphatilytica]QEL10920.1 D-alanyl-D-alanine carboxypeptidase [Kushneria phosphatilytica]